MGLFGSDSDDEEGGVSGEGYAAPAPAPSPVPAPFSGGLFAEDSDSSSDWNIGDDPFAAPAVATKPAPSSDAVSGDGEGGELSPPNSPEGSEGSHVSSEGGGLWFPTASL